MRKVDGFMVSWGVCVCGGGEDVTSWVNKDGRLLFSGGCDPMSGCESETHAQVQLGLMGSQTSLFLQSGAKKWVWPSLKTEVSERGGGKRLQPGDRFLSPLRGFYTWFNMLPVEFGSILHSGPLCHSHFRSNCWPVHTSCQKLLFSTPLFSIRSLLPHQKNKKNRHTIPQLFMSTTHQLNWLTASTVCDSPLRVKAVFKAPELELHVWVWPLLHSWRASLEGLIALV